MTHELENHICHSLLAHEGHTSSFFQVRNLPLVSLSTRDLQQQWWDTQLLMKNSSLDVMDFDIEESSTFGFIGHKSSITFIHEPCQPSESDQYFSYGSPLCHASFLRTISKGSYILPHDCQPFIISYRLTYTYELLNQKLPQWWSFMMTSSYRHRIHYSNWHIS